MVAQKVTREMVFAEANRLAEQGIVPTAKKLLAEIGMGSLTTHSKYLKLWQQHYGNHDVGAPALSSTVTGLSLYTVALFQSAITQCWQQGLEQGQADSQQQLKKLKEQLRRIQQQLKQAQESSKADTSLSTSPKKSRHNKPRKAFQGLALGGSHASKDN